MVSLAKQYAYQNAWISENCDRVNLTLPKGEREQWKAAAQRSGESLNAFIRRAVAMRIQSEEQKQTGNEPETNPAE